MTASDFLLVAGIYLAVIVSPGPATLAIAATAMERGRAAGLSLALGVTTGSATWGLAAALGMGAVMEANAWTLAAVRLAGGAYLLFLGWKCARAAWKGGPPPSGRAARGTLPRLWRAGLFIHLTNPKAILFWASLFSTVLGPEQTAADLSALLGMCLALAIAVFCGYALVFSTPRAMAAWARAARPLYAGLSAIFGGAGASLLLSRAAAN